MRSILSLALLVLLVAPAAFVPTAAAAPVCQTLERSVPVAALQTTTTVRTDSCTEVITGTGYTYQIWTNMTVVRAVSGATGYTSEVLLFNQHVILTTASGVYEDRIHTYRANAYDWDSPALRFASLAADNYQGKAGGSCFERTGVAGSQNGPVGSTGAGQSLYGGSSSAHVLPCTSEDVQTTLP